MPIDRRIILQIERPFALTIVIMTFAFILREVF